MVNEFKSREQLALENSEKIEEELSEYFSEKELVRFKRILNRQAKDDDRLFISNSVVKTKFNLRNIYIKLDELYSKRAITKSSLELNLTIESKQQHEKYLNTLDDYIENLKEKIYHYGAMLINSYIPLLDEYFSKDEIVQLLSGSYSEAKMIEEYYDKKETGTNSITDSFIIHHVEYRWRKGRSKDFIDCPLYEMPLFNCITTYIRQSIKKNSRLSAEMNKLHEEMFGDAMICTTTDSDGNIIEVEKLFRTLTHNELIRDYQGAFINKLRQKDILDNETLYRIKRADKGVYYIIGEEKEVIVKIYKK